MAIYRAKSRDGNPFAVCIGKTRYYVDPSRPYDTNNREDKMLLDAFPGHFVRDGEVEQASAAPGEKRNVRR